MYRTRISGVVTRVELKNLNGQAACTITVPANFREYVNKAWQDGTHWYEITFWDDKAQEAYRDYIKGDVLEVEGRLDVRTWPKNDGSIGVSYRLQSPFIEFSPKGRDKAAHDAHLAALTAANGAIGEIEDLEQMAAEISGDPGGDIAF